MASFTGNRILVCGLTIVAILVFAGVSRAERVAIVVPERNPATDAFAERLGDSLKPGFKIADRAMSETAFASYGVATPFNLEAETAKSIGAGVGADFLILIKGGSLRRYSFEKKEYYESFAAIFVVSTRSGRLADFELSSFDAADAPTANRLLAESAATVASAIATKIGGDPDVETSAIPDAPDADSPDAKGFKPPLPYKRISPVYTKSANLYAITATVDIEVEFDADGRIVSTRIVRWAGFGLDDSVTDAVRKMNWRPASRNGKNTPVRVLLRYNFRKIDPED